jgi:hypothetical protein
MDKQSSSLREIKQLERDYHPVPQEHTNPDHMVVPMVLPAQLDKIRFDEHNLAHTTYLDARARMYSELLKVVGFDFIECFTLPLGTTSRASRAVDVIQVAYLATECVKQLADVFESDRVKFEAGCGPDKTSASENDSSDDSDGSGKADRTTRLPMAVECPRGLIWCCAYTPPGIENPYWVIERSMCQYTLFVLSMQMAFLNLHLHRRPKYTAGGRENGNNMVAEKLEKAKNTARVCRMHLDIIVANWESGHFSDLANYGMIPDREIMEKTFGDIVDLMHMDYRIFHVELPMFMDSVATWRRVQESVLLPREITVENAQTVGSKLAREHTMEVLAQVVIAYNKATFIYDGVFAETLHGTDGSDTYSKSLTIRHSCLAQIAKYLIQAPLVYRFLAWVLKFNLVARDRRLNLIDCCFNQIKSMFKDPCFRLFMYQGSEDIGHVQQVKEIYDERSRAAKQFDPSTKIMAAQNSEYIRTDVAIPGEIYECDLLFAIWSMQMFAQFPPVLISSFGYIVNGLNNFMVKSTMIDREVTETSSSSQLPGIDDEVSRMTKSATKPRTKDGYRPSEETRRFVNKFIKSVRNATEVLQAAKSTKQRTRKGKE